MKAKSALSAAPRPLLRPVAALLLVVAPMMLPIPAAAAAPPKIPEAAKQSLDLARANFAAWDFQHKGTLTRAEVETDMQKPEFKGDAAAALAGLKWSMQSKDPTNPAEIKWISGVSLADLDAIETALNEAGKVDNPGFNSAVGHFTGGQKRIQKEPRAL